MEEIMIKIFCIIPAFIQFIDKSINTIYSATSMKLLQLYSTWLWKKIESDIQIENLTDKQNIVQNEIDKFINTVYSATSIKMKLLPLYSTWLRKKIESDIQIEILTDKQNIVEIEIDKFYHWFWNTFLLETPLSLPS